MINQFKYIWLNELNNSRYVVYKDTEEGIDVTYYPFYDNITHRKQLLDEHKVADFVNEDDAVDYCRYLNDE